MDEQGIIFIWIFSAVITIVIGKLIYNWYAEIAKRNKQAEINNRLLTLLARKMNASEQEINEAWNA